MDRRGWWVERVIGMEEKEARVHNAVRVELPLQTSQ